MKKLTILGSQNSAPKNCPNNLGGALVNFLEVQWFRYFLEIMKESGMTPCGPVMVCDNVKTLEQSKKKKDPWFLWYIGDEILPWDPAIW